MTLYLLNHANYYNRIVKRYNTVDDYTKNSEMLDSFGGINFVPGDGIRTTQILNYSGEIAPNYLLVANQEEVASRWYIIKSDRTREGQYLFTLLRDVVADWYDDIIAAPCFIEKATARLGDTAIYNNENMTYNQVKTREQLLKDNSWIPWIVGYVARDYPGGHISIPKEQGAISAEYASITDYPYYEYKNQPLYSKDTITQTIFRYNFFNAGTTGGSYVVAVGQNGQPASPQLNIQKDAVTAYYYWIKSVDDRKGYRCPYTFTSGKYVIGEASRLMYDKFDQVSWSEYGYRDAGFTNIQDISIQTIQNEDGKIIKGGDKYYRVSVSAGSSTFQLAEIAMESTLGRAMKRVITDNEYIDLDDYNAPVYQMEVAATPYYFNFEEIGFASYEADIPNATSRPHLEDAPYDMFAIPYGSIFFLSRTESQKTNKDVGMRVAAELQLAMGPSVLYDIQLLPFGPFPDNIITGPESMFQPMIGPISAIAEAGISAIAVRDGDNNLGSLIVWLTKSNFTKYLNYNISVPKNNLEFKVANECDMYRLSSPNYNTSFEFSATKNNGVNGFRADLSYKPINPYIRVAPTFGGLYGTVQDDARGLVCGGDFSLAQVIDQWLEYERNNKNYQQIFDRQIENMEINNSVARIQEKWAVRTGTVQGVASGAMAGGMMGGGYGAVAGAVVGGFASAAGGAADIRLNEQLRAEAIDYAKDQFGYQLGNIQALPTGLAKISSFNPNNKVFPVLEYYTATDIEKQALRNKIKYNGMTIMRVGTIEEFIQKNKSYIKGKLIRTDEFTKPADYNIINTIANEINKGVFI